MKGNADRLCATCGTFTQHRIIEPRKRWQCLNCDAIVPPDTKHPGAVALGRLGGLASAQALTKAERKARASAAGKRGGWPKGKPRKRPAEQAPR